MPVNLLQVFDHPKEFVLPKVPLLNFESSRDARGKERIQICLLSQIQEVSKEMVGGNIGDEFPFIPPPSSESSPTRLKRPRYLEGGYHG